MRPPRPSLQPPAVALEPRATVKLLQPDVDIDPLGGLRRRIEIALLPEVESAVTGDRCSANVQVGNGSV